MTLPDRGFVPGLRGVSALALAVALAGCAGPAAPSYIVNVPFSTLDVAVGTGDEAQVGKWLVLDYYGWLYNGSQLESKGSLFDTSVNRPEPFVFKLGAGQVIAGWDQGVAGMKVGGVRRLVIPPAQAYGSTGSGPIPPNATLVFDINLLAVSDIEPGTEAAVTSIRPRH